MRSSEHCRRALHHTLRAITGLCALVAVAVSTRTAHAQSAYFYLDRAQLSGAPDDGFMVWRPHHGDETRFYAFAALGYAHNTLRDATVTDDPATQYAIDDPVRGQFITYLSAGTEISHRLSLNVSLPVLLYKIPGGDDPQGYGVGGGGITGNRAGIHDLRFDARFMLFENNDRTVRIGAGGAFWAPTGSPDAFAGDNAVSGMLYASGEVDFKKWFLTGMMGPQFRTERSIGGVNGTLYTDSELRFAFGAFTPFRSRLRLGVELWGTTGIAPVGPDDKNTFFGSDNTDIEWLAQGRFALDKRRRIWSMAGFGTRLETGYGAPDFRALISIGTFITLKDFDAGSPPPKVQFVSDHDLSDPDSDGDGYPDSIDKCPHEKEDGKPPEPSDGCPASADRDKDGIPDNVDQCPDQPEDKDGIQDDDGCPETDADSDAIPDVEDKCPNEAGVRSADPKKVGCPSLTKVSEGGEVELLRPIEFEYGKAVILPVSFPILDEVLELLKSRPSIKVGVYGHTDNRGALALNMRLSKDRAAACKNYLINHGINATRLESQGFGPNQPLGDNSTDEGRARNRRVEFKILKE
ncbi:MAG TPA: OmpA family protein [Polyangiaceae bacterium]|nr:OmpA family protein [Polyangiaceae bacterium]